METNYTRTVAIVGRPNVGKSALFNRLAGRKISIVHDQPGVTRDRLATECKLGKVPFTIIDTGGIGSGVDASFSEQVHAEVDIAIATAQVILFVVDGQTGINPVDQDLAKRLRKIDKPLILVVNKIDHPKHTDLDAEFSRLGFPGILSVSAEHGRGINELVTRIETRLPEIDPNEIPAKRKARAAIAIVGRPNVGKSSLINAILHDNRTLVSDISGTTRDAVDVPYTRKDRHYTLIDTAGIRARGKIDNSVEIFSAMRSEKSIRRADLCVLVIDASVGITMQDKKIAGLIQEAQKPCVLAINKWDLIKPDEHDRDFLEKKIQDIRDNLFFLDYAPVLLLSAKTGENMSRLFRGIDQVREDSLRKIGTGPLNRLVQRILSSNPPAIRGGKRFKILYATQVSTGPEPIPVPKFLLFVNDTKVLTGPYRKFLEAQIREEARFLGLPVLLQLRGREVRSKEERLEENATKLHKGTDPTQKGTDPEAPAKAPKKPAPTKRPKAPKRPTHATRVRQKPQPKNRQKRP